MTITRIIRKNLAISVKWPTLQGNKWVWKKKPSRSEEKGVCLKRWFLHTTASSSDESDNKWLCSVSSSGNQKLATGGLLPQVGVAQWAVIVLSYSYMFAAAALERNRAQINCTHVMSRAGEGGGTKETSLREVAHLGCGGRAKTHTRP